MSVAVAPQAGSVSERGEAIYERTIRPQIEAGNKGRVVVIDIETGNYELRGSDPLEASQRLRERNPNAVLYARRIGYRAVTKRGGSWKQFEQD